MGPLAPRFHPKTIPSQFADTPLMVSMLLDTSTHCWKENLINYLFETSSAQAILSIPIPTRLGSNKLIWIPDSLGVISVKSAYRSSSQHVNTSGLCESFWKKLGKIKTPKRIKMLLWRIGSNNLPTRDKLATRICILDLSCVLCGHSFESVCHLFFHCPAARAIWFSTCWGLRSD